MHKKCLRCGRALKNAESQKIGYGPTCNKRRLRAATSEVVVDESLFDVIRDLQAQIQSQNQVIAGLQSELAGIKASGVVVQPTVSMPSNMPPAPPMSENPVELDEIVLSNDAPDLAKEWFTLQDELNANLAQLRKIADESIGETSFGTVPAKKEDTSGMDVLKIMEAKIKGEN
jgi:hypothetical protein